MANKDKMVITVSTREASLKKRFRRHLKLLGFHKADDGSLLPPGTGKDVVRTIHGAQRDDRLALSEKFLSEKLSKLIKHFASGEEVDPAKISPVLQPISSKSWEGDLFRLASLTWSVPVSNGFGRRLRFLVWDEHNGKLMGIIAIGDPVFNLHASQHHGCVCRWRFAAVQYALGRKACRMSSAQQRHLRPFYEGLWKNHGHNLGRGEEGPIASGYDLLFNGSVVSLQSLKTRRNRIFQSYRLVTVQSLGPSRDGAFSLNLYCWTASVR